MALDVGLVHDVDAVTVEHGHHLGLTRVVTGAYGIDVGLLHHLDVLHHRLETHGAACHRVRVLCVDPLEVNALTIDVNKISALLDVAEAILGREHHQLFAFAIHLPHDNGIELRVFS